MSKDERKQQQIIRASKQLAMLATLRLIGLITEQEYDIVVASIYRDYPVIVGLNLK
ncbi:conjugal transfer protein [Acetivibrio straminisolvens]|uniref:conjugal transfer protein n=1 Tax=Acetivibrio straminisolvens TaxID=253314 RepID=UPI000E3E4621|nr:conjugal transfer protein [Acetivibrio straminisolvens]